MASRVGVRDLKNRASAIVREVHEHKAEREQDLAKLDDLAGCVARTWRSPRSGVELIDEQRR